jgi:hypothetical protein
MKIAHKPVPLPFHFKLPGRSYNQIGRKGNVALYSVYSDYFSLPNFALPYLLIGFELVVIKTKDGREVYPSAWQFGKSAWSIPKSLSQLCFTRPRLRRSDTAKLRRFSLATLVDRSTTSEASTRMAPRPSQTNQTAAKCSEIGTYKAQRRVSLREKLITNQPTSRWPGGAGVAGARAGGSPTGQLDT